jgi:hypothetical protein
MARHLASKGWDPEKFRPQLPPRTRAGHYPRTTEDGKQLLSEFEGDSAPEPGGIVEKRAMPKLTRYLVRRETKEVFIWTAAIATHKDLEEVYAESAADALKSRTIPDVRNMSIGDLEDMKKDNLILFAKTKLGIDLDATRQLAELREQVTAAISSGHFSAEAL